MLQSHSWRLTGPLRGIGGGIRALRRALGRLFGKMPLIRQARIRRIRQSPLFDADFYAERNPDVVAAGVDLAKHYALSGWKEHRNPSVEFSTRRYLEANPDVAAAGINPLLHYIDRGKAEGRQIHYVEEEAQIEVIRDSGLFDADYYLATYTDIQPPPQDPIRHYCEFGWHEGRNPSAEFDTQGYVAAYNDVKAAGVNPFWHYVEAGRYESRHANPKRIEAEVEAIRASGLFDVNYYFATYPDVQLPMDLIRHYCEHGWHEGRNPSKEFDTRYYLETYRDIKDAGINPFWHYAVAGRAEFRHANPERERKQRFEAEVAAIQASGLFDANYYFATYPDIHPPINPIRHYCEYGWREGRNPSKEFNTRGYLEAHCDIKDSGINPFWHYCVVRRILVADRCVPRPDVSAEDWETVDILQDLCVLGYEVVFLPNDMKPSQQYEAALQAAGVQIVTRDSGFDSAARYLEKHGHKFGAFYLAHVDVAETLLPVARRVAPDARVIFHASDLYCFLREIRDDAELRCDWDGLRARARQLRSEDRCRPHPLPAPETPVDIIVPVYKGLDDTRRCLESVLAAQCATPWRLIVIDDASPEPELSAWLSEFAARDGRIRLLVNENNLGFVGTVNRGMRESSANDVLLLNSDTEVANDWLDRLRTAAYSDQRVASVTPFSNNATICSWPVFCEDNELPAGWDCARIDTLMARVNAGEVVDVPTGVGFCMYIRRAALDAVGLFDEEHFGKGYGEENDFCCRASRAGWRNLHALDTFVQHYGGVSFGDAKKPREAAAMQTMRSLHPNYEMQVCRFIALDPARLARACAIAACATDGDVPVICAVLHDRGGGTERHVWELAAHLGTQAYMPVLQPLSDQRLLLRLGGLDLVCDLVFTLPGDEHVILDVLRQLQVRHIHYHHLIGHSDFVRELPARLGVSYDFTAHDYFSLCPQISLTDWRDRYCGERGNAQCAECLAHTPAPDGSDIAGWRQHHAAFLEGARYVIAPSRDTAVRIARLMPDAQLVVVPHTDIDPVDTLPVPAPTPLTDERPLKVAVIGAMSRIKGADTLEAVAIAAKKSGAPVEFQILGYNYRRLNTDLDAVLTISGRYDEADLPHMLRQLQPDVVWFPAQWPETYSYTLSACLLLGLPIVAPDLGAFPERLAGRSWSWICDWQQTPQEWLDFFTRIRAEHFATGQPPAPCPPVEAIAALESVHALPLLFSMQWYRSTYLEGVAPPCEGTRAPSDEVLCAHLRRL